MSNQDNLSNHSDLPFLLNSTSRRTCWPHPSNRPPSIRVDQCMIPENCGQLLIENQFSQVVTAKNSTSDEVNSNSCRMPSRSIKCLMDLLVALTGIAKLGPSALPKAASCGQVYLLLVNDFQLGNRSQLQPPGRTSVAMSTFGCLDSMVFGLWTCLWTRHPYR
jgi:hypothetical protein